MNNRKAQTVRLPAGLAERLRVLAFTRREPQSAIMVRGIAAEVTRMEAEDR